MKMPNDISGNYSDRARELIFESARDMRNSLEDFLNGKSEGREDVELFNVVKGYAVDRLSRDLKLMVLTGDTYAAKDLLNDIASLVEAEY